jgi:hypothetical protein
MQGTDTTPFCAAKPWLPELVSIFFKALFSQELGHVLGDKGTKRAERQIQPSLGIVTMSPGRNTTDDLEDRGTAIARPPAGP